MAALPNLSPEIVEAYKAEVAKNASPATVKRKTISLNRFFGWAEAQGHIPQNPMSPGAPRSNVNPFIVSAPKKGKISVKTWAITGLTMGMAVLIFLFLQRLKLPIPFITNFAQESKIQTPLRQGSAGQATSSPSPVPANSAVIASWNLFAKLKLTSVDGSAQVGTQTLSFKIYNSPTGGTALYTSQPQSITTDASGSALISLEAVPTDLFFQNEKLYLEPEIASQGATSQRILIPTANVASNLNEYPAANPETGAQPLTIPVLDSTGSLVMAGQSPAVKATAGNLLIEGQAVTLKATDGSGGNIEINPDANGYAHFLFEGNSGNFLNAQAPNLTSGSLYYGMVPNSATGYYLLKLQSGSPKLTTRYSVDAVGNTNQTGSLSTLGVTRLTSGGALQNITGYSQTSGNFTIAQNPGDFASISKTGTALSDVLTLTLDERPKPKYSNTGYSTLVLNRYDGAIEGMALLVKNGNAQFNGQLRLGNFSSNPTAVGQGSLVYNSTDASLYYWNGSAWVALGTAATTPFSSITSGTNTMAAMIVGTGASLTYSGTGTINASSLEGKTWEVPGTIGSTTPNSGAFTTLNVSGLTASKPVFTDASKNLVSTGTVGADQGGTGFSSYTVGDLLYANTVSTLARLNDVATGNALISGGVGVAPSWGKVVLGTHTTGNYVSTITGTANQITASAATGDITLSIPSDFRAPGTVNAVSGVYTGAIAGTQRIDASGNLTNIGTTQLNGLTYTWPGSQTANYLLQTNGSGTLSWADPNTVAASTIYWTQASGALYPKNSTVDVLIGSNATTSAKFAFKNVLTGTPTASISGTTANVATFLTGEGNLATTNMANLTVGGSSTGNITLNPSNATGTITFSGYTTGIIHSTAGLLSSSAVNLAGGATEITGILPLANGGTNANLTAAAGGIVYSGASALAINTAGTSGMALLSGGTGAPTFGTLGTTYGGTGQNFSATAQGSVPYFSGTGVMAALAPSTANFVLTTQGASANPVWSDPNTLTASTNYWNQASGAVFPKNSSVDLLVGSSATTSAKFAFTGVNSGTPTASISGATNIATFIDGNGNISSTNRNNLTLGNSATYNYTGNILLNPNGTGNVGIGTTSPTTTLDVSGTGRFTSTLTLSASSGNALRISTGQPVVWDSPGKTSAFNWASGGLTLTGNTGQGTQTLVLTGDTSQTAALLHIKDSSSNPIFTALPSGNVGINNTSPSEKLDVVGNATVSGNLTFTGAASTIANRLMQPLTLGDSQTGAVRFFNANNYIDGSGNFKVTGTTTFNSQTYTWPGSIPANNYLLQAQTSGALAWVDPNTVAASTIYWTQAAGALYPKNSTVDVLIGSSATTSAKFAFKNVLTGVPTASISGTTANVATYLTGEGNLAVTNMANLNLGGTTTGNVNVLNTSGTAFTTFDAINGRVGIGTTGPQGNLHVYGSSANVQELLERSANTSAVFTSYKPAGAASASNVQWVAGMGGNSNDYQIWYYNGSSNSYPVTVKNNGNVGIGNTSPTEKLDVAGNATVSGNLTFTGAASTIANRLMQPLTLGDSQTGAVRFFNANNYIDGSGNLKVTGTTTFNTQTYTWPGSIPANNYLLQAQTSGSLAWVDPNTVAASTIYWTQASGALYPKNSTVDVLIGASATTSAKFGFINVNSGSPTATVSGNMSLVTPTGANPATTHNILNGGTFNLQTSVGGDAGLGSRLFVTNAGNVGIGTTTPSLKASIYGTDGAPATSGTTQTGIMRLEGPTNNVLDFGKYGGSPFGAWLQVTDRTNLATSYSLVLQPNGGNVGIGTTGPSTLLHLSSTGNTFETVNSAAGSQAGLILADGGTNKWQAIKHTDNSYVIYDYAANRNVFQAFSSGNLSLMPTAGNVGIGTTGPIAPLQIRSHGSGSLPTNTGLYLAGVYNAGGTVANQIAMGVDTNASAVMTIATRSTTGNTYPLFMDFTSNGTPLMTISTAGNVGIGNTSPTEKLDVAGNATVSGNLTFTGAASTIANRLMQPLTLGDSQTGGIRFFNANNYIDGSGNIKVTGTTTFNSQTYTWPGSIPANNYLLQAQTSGALAWVDPNTVAASTIYWTQASGALYPKNSTVDVLIGGSATTSAKFAFINVNSGSPTATISGNMSLVTPTGANPATTHNILNGGTFNLQTSVGGDAGLASRLFVTNAGNVGIGTTGPGAKLHIADTNTDTTTWSRSATTILRNTNATNNSWAGIENDSSNGVINSGIAFVNTDQTNNYGRIDFAARGAAGWNAAVMSINNGNVGIGTAGPTTKLDVNGPGIFWNNQAGGSVPATPQSRNAAEFLVAASSLITLGEDTAGNANPAITMYRTSSGARTGTATRLYQPNSSGDLYIQRGNNGVAYGTETYSTSIAILGAGGNVGIGNTSPLEKLDVAGNATISGNLTFTGAASTIANRLMQPLTLGDSQTGGVRFFNANNYVDSSGNFKVTGTTTFGGLTYTWPASIPANNYLLQAQTSGALAWVDPNTVAASTIYWTQASGALYPKNSTVDVLIGSNATSSAKFGFINVNSGSPTATISGNMSLVTPTGANPATTHNILNGGTFNLQTSVGGDAGLGSRLFVTNAGNVGIGTTGPLVTLDVQGYQLYLSTNTSARFAKSIVLANTQGVNAVNAAGDTQYSLAYLDSSNNAHLAAGGGSGYTTIGAGGTTEFIRITNAGNVGIGNISPTEKLDVAGNATVSGNLTFTGAASTIANRLMQPLTLGDSQTGAVRFFNANNYIDGSGNFKVTGTTTFNTQTYTWPGSQTSNFLLQTNGSGVLSWADPNTVAASTIYWTQAAGALYPKNSTVDVLIGSSATTSAKFAFKNVLTGVPTASISGTTANVATYLTGEGNLATTNMANLNLGGTTTGNVNVLNTSGTAFTTFDAINQRVGIGTTTPQAQLQTGTGNIYFGPTTPAANLRLTVENNGSGNLRLQGSTTNSRYRSDFGVTSAGLSQNVYDDTGATYLPYVLDASTFSFRQAAQASVGLFINSSGNVGIGTTSPPSPLAVHGANTGLYSTAGLTVQASDYTTNFGTIGIYKTTGLNQPGTIQVADNSNYQSLLLNPAGGNVGIGTTSPQGKFFVNLTTNQNIRFSSETNAAIGAVNDLASAFVTFKLDGSTLLLNSQSNGNVGIGNTSPTEKLDVAGNATVSGNLTFTGAASTIANRLMQPLTLGDSQTGAVRFFNANNYVDSSGNFKVTGTTTFNTQTYTWPGSQTANYLLQTNGSGTLSWADPNTVAASTIYWTQASGALYPKNSTVDVLIGASATASAKFAFKNVLTGVPTASISGTTANVATYLTGEGNLAVTNMANLSLGGTTTGNVNVLNTSGTAFTTFDAINQRVGIGTTTLGTTTLNVKGANTAYGTLALDVLNSVNTSLFHVNNNGTIGIIAGAEIRVEAGGAGAITLGAAANADRIKLGQVNNTAFSEASGNTNFLNLTPFVGQSGTAGYTALNISSTETSLGSGANYFINAKGGASGTTQNFFVKNDGTGYFAGNVGIGNTSPTEKLDVAGNATVSGNLTFYGGVRSIQNTLMNNLTIGGATTGTLQFYSSANTLDSSGNIKIAGTTTFGGLTYTWPGSQTANYLLQTNGSGVLSWADPNTVAASTIYWTQAAGALYPKNSTVDVLIGSNATTSAKFGFINVNSGNPTATVSGNMSLVTPTGANPATTHNILNGGTFNLQTSVGGDAGLASRLFVTNAGNVGIGTVGPGTWKLNVAGNSAIGAGAGAAGLLRINEWSNYYLDAGYADANGGAYLQGVTNGANSNLNLNPSGGNVGIGTTGPGAKLDIYDSSNYPLSVRSTGSSFTGILGLGQASGVAAIQPFTAAYGAYANLSLVPSGGNVGIGTTNPALKLEVAGTDAAESGTATPNGALLIGHGLASNSQVLTMGVKDGVGFHAWIQSRNNTSANFYNLALNPSGGNVGIGNTSPSEKLDVAGNATVSGNLTFTGAASTIANRLMQPLTLGDSQTGAVRFFNANNYIDGSGNFKVTGTTTFNTQTYTWPGSQTANYLLQTNGSGTLSWADPNTVAASTIYWTQAAGALYPKNSTVDVLIGSNATSSAKFGFINVNSGNPTATVSGNMSLVTPTGANPATTHNILNGGTFNLQTSVGGDAGLASRLFVTNAGNVGIGMTGPSYPLQVNGTISLGSSNLNELTPRFITYDDGSNASYTTYGVDAFTRYKSTSSFIWKSVPTGVTRLSAAGTQTMNLDASGNLINAGTLTVQGTGNSLIAGNVGIGNTTPNYPLDVTGVIRNRSSADASPYTQARIFVYGGNVVDPGNWAYFGYGQDAQMRVVYSKTSSANSLLFGTSSATDNTGVFTPTMTLTATGNLNTVGTLTVQGAGNSSIAGNVGIGNTSPTEKLDVAGNATVSGNLTFTGAASTIANRLMQPLTLGDSQTGAVRFFNANNYIDGSGNFKVTGTTTFNSQPYTWPGSQTANYLLQTNGSGTLSWADPNTVAASTIYWTQASGALYPKNSTVDVLIGSNATSSAKFGFINVNAGSPTATISGNMSLVTPTGANPATTHNILNGGTFNLQTSVGGDAGLGSRLFVTNAGNVGIGTTGPGAKLDVRADTGIPITWGSTTAIWGSLNYNGSTSTTIYAASGKKLDLGANATSGQVVIDTTGNVGIGNTSPTEKLDVAGNATISGNLTFTGAASTIANRLMQPLQLGDAQTGNINFFNANNYISSGGNLKVTGTTTFNTQTYTWPGSQTSNFLLQTNGSGVLSWADPNTVAASTIYWTQASGALYPKNSTVDVLIGSNATSSAKFGFINVNSGNPTATVSGNMSLVTPTGANPATTHNILNGGTFNLQTSVGGDAGLGSRLFVTNAGNVGIGTAGPGSWKLNIAGTTAIGAGGGAAALLRLNEWSNYYLDAGYADANGGAYLQGVTNGANSNLNLNPSGGNVGIGTTSPGQLLDLASSGGPTMIIRNSADSSNGMSLRAGGGDLAGFIDLQRSNGPFYIRQNTTTRLAIDGTGNVGIGTTSPSEKLDVAGNATVSGNLTFTGAASTIANRLMQPLTLGDSQTGGVRFFNANNYIDGSGNLKVTGTTTFNSQVYTWPGSQTANYLLQTNGSGILSWADPNTVAASTIYWTQANGALFPKNSSVDVLIGSNATTSAKFAFTGVNSGTPTASVSAGVAGATYLTADGKLATTAKQNLTLGDTTTTGNVIINPSGNVGIGTTGPSQKLEVAGNVLINGGVPALYLTDTSVGISRGTSLSMFHGNSQLDIQNSGSFTVKTNGTGLRLNIDSSGNFNVNQGQMYIQQSSGNVGIANTSPTEKLDVAGNATISGNLTFYGAARSIQGVNSLNLTVGGNTTGNIILNPLNALAGGYVAPNTTNVSDLGTSSLLWRNIYGTTIYQGGNQVCDLSGNCTGSAIVKWRENLGTLSPYTSTLDVLIGSNATSSAKLGFINVNSGTPTATIAGTTSNVATYLTGNGNLAVTNMAHLTLGGSTTGQVDVNNSLNLSTGNAFLINGISVLNNNTLGSGVLTSSLTTVGALASGSIANGFGTIATANTITGTVINGTTGINTGAGAGTQRIDASGNLTSIGTTQFNGITYTWPASSGSSGYALTTNGSNPGTLSWTAASGLGTNYWNLSNGALYPQNNSVDLLVGGNATTSAKFAFTNVNSGTPTASISASPNSTYLTATGTLATTNMQNLTIGASATTGNVQFFSSSNTISPTGNLTVNGAVTASTGVLQAGSTLEVLRNFAVPQRIFLSSANDANVPVLYADANGQLTLNAQGTQAVRFNFDKGTGGVIIGNGAGAQADIFTSSGALGLGTTPIEKLDVAGNATVSGNLTFYGGARSIQSVNSSNLTVGGLTTGNIILNPLNALAGGYVAPNTTNVSDLGLTGTQWRKIYGVNIYQNNNQVCDTSGNCNAVGNFWGQALGALYPVNNTVDLLIGASATTSAKFAFMNVLTGTPTASVSAGVAGAAYLTADGKLATTAKQNLTLGDTTTTGNVIINPSGNVGIGTTGPGAKLDIASGHIKLSDTYGILGGSPGLRLIRGNGTDIQIGDTASWANIDFFAGAATQAVRIQSTGNVGIGTTAPISKLHVATNTTTLTGKATGVFDQLEAQDILTASASGVTKFTVDRNGNLGIGGSAVSASNYITAPNFVLNTSGQITTGAWMATVVGTQYGGTGQNWSAVAQGSIPYFSATGVMAALAPGTSGYVLTTQGAGANPVWTATSGLGTNYWNLTNGALYPQNNSVDLLVGGTATTSAKFAFMNVLTGTPTASIAGTVANVATYLTGNGNLATTNMANLTIGGSSTGNITLNPSNGTGTVTFTGYGGGVLSSNTSGVIASNNLTGMLKGNGTGTPTAITSIGGYAAYWTDNNTIAGEQYLATSRGGLGSNVTAAGTGELLYSSGTTTYNRLPVGTSGMTLLSAGAAPPSWGTLGLTYGGTNANLSGVTQGSIIYKGASALAAAPDIFDNGTNIGIGTITPGEKLDVAGNATVSGNLTFYGGVRSIQNTLMNNLTIGGNSTGNITLSPSAGAVGSYIAPSTNNQVDLGTSSLAFRNLYTNNVISGGTTGTQGWWQRNAQALSPANITDDILLGATATSSALIKLTGTAGNNSWINTGNVGIGKTVPLFKLDVAGSASISATLSLGPMLQIDAGTCNASSAGKEYYDATQNKYYFCNGTAWTAMGSGSGGSNWTLDTTNGILFPNSSTVDVLFGGTATTSAKFAFENVLTGVPTASIAGNIANVATYLTGNGVLSTTNARDLTLGGSTTGQVILNSRGTNTLIANGSNVTIAGNLAVNGGNITTTQTALNIAVANTGTISFTDGTNNLVQIADQGTAANVGIGGSLQVGCDLATVGCTSGALLGYNRFVTANTVTSAHGLSTAKDVLIGGILELDGIFYLDNGTIGNSAGTATIVFSSTPTTTNNSLSASSWLVENTANVGLAALLVNQTKGGDLFTASSSGVTKFTIANNGNVTINGSGTMLTVGGGTGKIDVGTIDPVYNIGGTKYATYLSGMTGVKEETTGAVSTSEYVAGVGYRQTIDFKTAVNGTDLWLFSKTTNLKANMDKMVVLLSASQNTRAWYAIDSQNYILSIYTARPSAVSYRLTAPRFDYADWSNYNNNPDSSGFNVPDNNFAVNPNGNASGSGQPSLADFIITPATGSARFNLKDTLGNIIYELGTFSDLLAANIEAGIVNSQQLIANSLTAMEATINNLTISNKLISPIAQIDTVQTKLISPLPDQTDVAIQIGNSNQALGTSSGQLVIQNASGSAVASVDTSGNARLRGDLTARQATFSGTLYADKIKSTTLDDINNLLHQVQQDQNLLSQAATWSSNTASASSTLASANIGNLFVTNQAAINSLSVTSSLTIGTDIFIQSTINNQLSTISNSINSLSAPLRIQSLAMAPIEMMAGKFKIATNGDVTISGNLYVAGIVESSGFSVRPINNQLSTISNSPTASIDASGSAMFNSVSADKFILAAQAATQSADINGTITTNATAGQAIIKAGVSEITIKNPSISDYTLVYVTPSSSTLNNVLYVKSKGAGYFTVGFTNPINVDVTFNWWVIDTKQ